MVFGCSLISVRDGRFDYFCWECLYRLVKWVDYVGDVVCVGLWEFYKRFSW